MFVNNVTFSEGYKGHQGGVVVETGSDVLYEMGTLFYVDYNGESEVFKIISVKTNNQQRLVYTLRGYGYSSIERRRALDIRKLIDAEITEITDEEVIKKIKRSSSYC